MMEMNGTNEENKIVAVSHLQRQNQTDRAPLPPPPPT